MLDVVCSHLAIFFLWELGNVEYCEVNDVQLCSCFGNENAMYSAVPYFTNKIMYQSLRISTGRCAIILDFYGGGVFRSVPGKILHLKGHSSFCKIDSYTHHTCGVAYFFSPHDWVSSKTFSGIVLLCSKYDKTVKLFNKYMCQTFSKRVFDLHLKIINHIFKITSSKLNSYTS